VKIPFNFFSLHTSCAPPPPRGARPIHCEPLHYTILHIGLFCRRLDFSVLFLTHELPQTEYDMNRQIKSYLRSGFATRAVHVGFVVDKVALGQVSLGVLRLSPVSIIPPLLHIHSCIILRLGNGPISGRNSTETQSHPTPQKRLPIQADYFLLKAFFHFRFCAKLFSFHIIGI
jgi:hypothetical protein